MGLWDHLGVVELVPGVFVAREAELGALERAAAGCCDGVGSALVVAGEAGVGKSRLLAEASVRARGAGMLVLRGRAAPGAGQAPFRAVAEALAGGLRERAVSEESLELRASAGSYVAWMV
jgi:predicted ATPase